MFPLSAKSQGTNWKGQKLITIQLALLFSIIGAIITGLMSDLLHARATSSVIMMYLAVPTVSGIIILVMELSIMYSIGFYLKL